MSDAEKTVLVVDDDSLARTIVVAMLEGEGWEAIEGEDGGDVIPLAKRNHPDLIILDLMMPGVSGFEAYKELKEDPVTASIPVVMLTAVNDFDLGVSHSAQSIADDLGVRAPERFVEKPVDLKELMRILSEVLH